MPASQNSLYLPTLTNGKLWIGNGSTVPTAANLSAGNGISIVSSSGSINISTTLPWNTITVGTGIPVSPFNIYYLQSGGLITLVLPSSGAQGDKYTIYAGATLFSVATATPATQKIYYGNTFGSSLSNTVGTSSVSLEITRVNSSGTIFIVSSTNGIALVLSP